MRECQGHPAGPSDPMGETVYCDGSCNPANYAIIENTPGYLPDDDNPQTFDSYAEALNHLAAYNKELSEDPFRFKVEAIVNGAFDYYDPIKYNDLGRHVEIVPLPLEGKHDSPFSEVGPHGEDHA